MFPSLFKKIDKNRYPAIVRKWSFSAYLATLVFTVGNKLYGYLLIILISSAAGFIIFIFKLESVVFNVIYVIGCAVNLLTVIYLIVFGRILVWDKFGYKDNSQDIALFKARLKRVLWWSIAYYIVILATVFLLAFILR